MKPQISYLIATKNRSKIIGETLQSLIDQTISGWEAIVVDDHGNDNTEAVIKKIADKRIKYFRLTDAHGHGSSCARNMAAIYAQAPIVAILDSDDITYPNRTKITIDFFRKNPKLDIFYGDMHIWEQEKGIVRDRLTSISPFSVKRLLEVNFIPHSTVAMRRQVLIDNPYNQFFRLAQDYELLSRLAVDGKKFAFTKEKITKYRMHSDNISAVKKGELSKKYVSLIKMMRGVVPYDNKILQEIEKLEGKQ